MTAKDMMADILESEKNLVVNMAISLNEASCDTLYKKYYTMFEEISMQTKELFAIAYNKGWYQLETAEEDKIEKAYNKFDKCLCDLDCDCKSSSEKCDCE